MTVMRPGPDRQAQVDLEDQKSARAGVLRAVACRFNQAHLYPFRAELAPTFTHRRHIGRNMCVCLLLAIEMLDENVLSVVQRISGGNENPWLGVGGKPILLRYIKYIYISRKINFKSFTFNHIRAHSARSPRTRIA